MGVGILGNLLLIGLAAIFYFKYMRGNPRFDKRARRAGYEKDREEILALRIKLASEDINEQNEAFALLKGINWGGQAEIDVMVVLHEYRMKQNTDRLAELKEIEQKIIANKKR